MIEKERENKEKLKLQKQFGAHLKKVRESKGLRASELSELCFMERSNIARLEAGRVNPTLFMIRKLAAGLDITIDELVRGLK
jgi:transcriptional regulator with XRE-family HTH domain